MMSNCPREASFQALYGVYKEIGTLSDFLERWQKAAHPSSKDLHLAQEISFGVERRLASLDFLARQLTHPNPLKLKPKEKIILRQAIYQAYFLQKIPLYAIVNESVRLAKRHCHFRFANFLNASLRKLSDIQLTLPENDTIEDLSIRFSYPPFFIEQLVTQTCLPQAKVILEIMNNPPHLMARKRFEKPLNYISFSSEQREEIAKSPSYYIQNITPGHLLASLFSHSRFPKTILDLCAAPGGKLIFAHELFPDAELFANDVSQKRLEKLEDNLRKYEISSHVSCTNAENYPEDKKFDLIILDVPCSNSGVLHKRPEARWRISRESLNQLEALQLSLIKKAARLLSPRGEIWYLTCSILSQENEKVIERACQEFSLKMDGTCLKCLPNQEGWDGGFACKLIPNKESCFE